MNYLWEVALIADEAEISRENLRYVPAECYSPYLEASFVDLNTRVPEESVVEVNPLYRFASVFAAIFDVNLMQSPKLRAMMFDICMQYLIQVDLRQGMTKDEYYLRFILRDMLSGVYGPETARVVWLFTAKEQRRLLSCMLALYRCGSSLSLFRKAMRAVYSESLVYASNDQFREILIYLGTKETADEREKIAFIIDMFLSFDYTTHLFWEHHFGIIDIEVTMELDEMVLF